MAVGDALGAPLEGLDAQQIRAHYGLVIDYVDGSRAWKKKPYRWRLSGLYTDDTQQALVLADVLMNRGRIEPERVAELYLSLAQPPGEFAGAHRGVGRSFRRVLNELHSGADPMSCGQYSAGIGAAMRIAPVAIYHQSAEFDVLCEDVITASLMTHRDCRSIAGAVAVACAVRRLLDGERREPSLALRLAGDVARAESHLAAAHADRVVSLRHHAHSVSRAVAHVESVLDLPRDRALAAIVDEANSHGAEPACRRPTQGFPPLLVPTCLYVLLTTDSFDEAIVDVVNHGGDADSAGAILGAMAGASYGLKELPQRWLLGLQNRAGIESRARALATLSTEGLEIPDLVETERMLTDRESEGREQIGLRPGGSDQGANSRI
jgi:ADP-ribosylglycohydrolase